MRVANLGQLNQLSMNAGHKAKIAEQLGQIPPASAKGASRSPAERGSRSGTGDQQTGSHPQRLLWQMLHADEACREYAWASDYVGAVPGRKFELDVACPAYRVGIEVDGWLWHGKRKQDFLRDREKDYCLMLEGWQVLRLQAGLLYKEPQEAVERARRFLDIWVPRQRLLFGE